MTSTYSATAHRSGDWWAIEVTRGLADDMLGVTQTRRLGDVEDATRDLIAELTDVDATDVDVDVEVVVPDDLSELVALFRHAETFEAAARTEAAAPRLGSSGSLAISPHHARSRPAARHFTPAHQATRRSGTRRRTDHVGRRSAPHSRTRNNVTHQQ